MCFTACDRKIPRRFAAAKANDGGAGGLGCSAGRYDNPGKSMMAFIKASTLPSSSSDTPAGVPPGWGGGVLTLDTPLGCDPKHPVTPPDGCVGWSGFSDVGNSRFVSML